MNKYKLQSSAPFIIRILIILLLGFILSANFFRIDLTAEKRYTLSDLTKLVLRNLDDIVYVKVYLEGNLNPQLTRLQTSIREMLDEFRIYGKDNIHYEFINPSEAESRKVRNEVYSDLYEKGLKPINIKDVDDEGGETEKIIFPGAIIHYRNTEVVVNLLKNNPSLSAAENLNNSRQALEYELINMIRNLTNEEVEKIAFTEGHGELDQYETADITRELANFFQVDRGRINGQYGILDEYKAIIIAKPRKAFSEKDKFVLDQYLMNGGKILWFLDKTRVSMDSLTGGKTVALINDLNLQDQLFKYGVRLNPVLVRDMQCNFVPVNTALAGNQPNFSPSPWTYFPLLNGKKTHPVSANNNLIKSQFAGSLDFIGDSTNLKKSVLLQTSARSKQVNVPVMISLEEVKEQPNARDFNQSFIPVVALLEGQFQSVFTNRMLGNYLPESATFKEVSEPTKMIVATDGDIIKNEVRSTPQGPKPLPLGYDSYTRQMFGNKDFVLNAVNYLTGQEELIQLRSREFKLRLLNRDEISKDKLKWQLINIVLPIIVVILFGITFNIFKRNKYSKRHAEA
ncbi:MAG: gliding motility-associated ABC transporter substrate-binding protein GldG [Bacteroidetes bacterium]|nr:gliding motility-associated ABC transporter substrate-binding protein GldG [Bacteroidota bacterium]